jgi:rubrerythrin
LGACWLRRRVIQRNLCLLKLDIFGNREVSGGREAASFLYLSWLNTFMFAKVAVKDKAAISDATILRQAIIAEQDAINLYEQMARSTKNAQLKKLLLDIAKEEKVHIGEFETLLEKVDKEHKSSMSDGRKEAKKLLEVSPAGWSGTVRAMITKHPDKFDSKSKGGGKLNPYAIAHSMKKKGAKSHYEEMPKKDSRKGKPRKKKKYKNEEKGKFSEWLGKQHPEFFS